ncbi:hypothetical protein CI102_12061 [Trichoderma harzianum]|nr:hypothetical protein CI102_12061 [Trichoderma harzianum]
MWEKRPHLKRRDRLSGPLTTPSKVIQGLSSKQKVARHPSGTRMISAWPSGGAERLLGRGLMKHGLCVYLVVIDTFALQREDFLGVHGTCWLPCNFDMSCRHSGLHDVFLVWVKDKDRHGSRRFFWSGTPTLQAGRKRRKKTKKKRKHSKKQARHTKRALFQTCQPVPLWHPGG